MKVIAKPRGAGKTTEVIKEASKLNGYIVCEDKVRVQEIAEQARRMNININLPMTYKDLEEARYYKGKTLKPTKILIDNVDNLLHSMFRDVNIDTITVTTNSPKAKDNLITKPKRLFK